ncbi:hypothetical protein DFP72DRAFT_851558 [Ephemerocybe angulata]|uniref:Secreted protein n=1 Tax=Ephemerocybe angulata TaxID=980116 RepID=A0A8H6HRB2_9AGAR|nr:hypothetical protein DFP72DRAFT_851558 [Tulosesus angulatus]
MCLSLQAFLWALFDLIWAGVGMSQGNCARNGSGVLTMRVDSDCQSSCKLGSVVGRKVLQTYHGIDAMENRKSERPNTRDGAKKQKNIRISDYFERPAQVGKKRDDTQVT